MKPLRYIFIMIMMALTIIVFSGPAYARGGGYHAQKLSREYKIKVLTESASALQQSNPDLSEALKKIAEEEHKGPGLLGELLGM